MMTEQETRARAERAAEWYCGAGNGRCSYYPTGGWFVVNMEDYSYFYKGLSDSMFIAFCEDRGFRDPIPTEAEAVFYLVKVKELELSYSSISGWHKELPSGEWQSINPVEEATRLGYAEGEG